MQERVFWDEKQYAGLFGFQFVVEGSVRRDEGMRFLWFVVLEWLRSSEKET